MSQSNAVHAIKTHSFKRPTRILPSQIFAGILPGSLTKTDTHPSCSPPKMHVTYISTFSISLNSSVTSPDHVICLHPSVTSSLLSLHILPINPFSHTLTLHYSFIMWEIPVLNLCYMWGDPKKTRFFQ